MSGKKNPSIFTLSFNPEIPRHVLATETLNVLGRKKSEFLAALIEAAATHPEAFGLVCRAAGDGRDGTVHEGDMSDAGFLVSMMEGAGFRRVNQPRGQARPRRAADTRMEGAAPGKEPAAGQGGILPAGEAGHIEEYGQKPAPAAEGAVQAVQGSNEDSPGEIPEELRGSFLANLQYFDELGEDDEDF